MSYKTITSLPSGKIDLLVLGLGKDNDLSELGQTLNEQLDGYIERLIKLESPEQKAGNTLLATLPDSDRVKRILFVSKGEKNPETRADVLKLVNAVASAAANTKAKDIVCPANELTSDASLETWTIKKLVLASEMERYQFTEFKSDKSKPAKKQSWALMASDANSTSAKQAIEAALATAEGMSLTRTLGNLPGNVCTPSYLAKQAKDLAKEYPEIKTTILDEKEMKALGMGALLSVSAGSDEPAKLIVMEYHGGKSSEKPQVLVGKGITFDSGGISLKPGEGMDEMKFDMCGAATVFGVMKAIARLKPGKNIIGVVAAAENMPSGKATKPGDIVRTMSGKTVEILNTDAEGRLVLCDTLTYVEKFKPAAVVDIATLTGACIIALGNHASGLMSNNDTLAADLLAAGEASMDRAWRLPIWDDYQQQLDSNFADMQNIGGRPAGTITAACFLSRFAENYPWAHLDIAGTAWNSGKNKGATGRPVPLLLEFLLNG